MRAIVLVSLAAPLSAQVGTVLSQQMISATQGGFAGPLAEDDWFGRALASLGDLDGDGRVELAVGAPGDDGGGPFRGAVHILSLEPSGRVFASRRIGHGTSGFSLPDRASFGETLAAVGDIDGDGRTELAVGAPGMQSVWILFLAFDGSVRLAREIARTHPVLQPPISLSDRFGDGLAALGDVNGDGVPDLAVAASGTTSPAYTARGAFFVLRMSRTGGVVSAVRISQVTGGGLGILDTYRFASSVTAGDLDGDLDADLLVLATPLGTTSYRFLAVFLDSNQQVVRAEETAFSELGLRADSGAGPLAWLGDVDGDGGPDLVMGASVWRASEQEPPRGAVVLTYLRAPPGRGVRRTGLIGRQRGGFAGALRPYAAFGSSMALLGDVNGDGFRDLAVGAPGVDDTGTRRGAVWILMLDGSPVNPGAGLNPLSLSQAAPPLMGRVWNLTLDCSAHAPGFARLWGHAARRAGVLTPYGELLLDPTSARLFTAGGPQAGVAGFPLPVPISAALVSLPLHVQGLCSGAPGARLSNAIDEIIAFP